MIDLEEKINFTNIKRYDISIHKCLKQFTKEDLDDCKSQRFSDLSGNPYIFDLEVGRVYDTIWDWKTLNDDGYMWGYILKDKWDGNTIIDDNKILGSAYSLVIINNFIDVTKEEIRNNKIETILE